MNKMMSFIFKLEHTIYCMTDCKVELFLHKTYYKYAKERYDKYIKRHHPEWCC